MKLFSLQLLIIVSSFFTTLLTSKFVSAQITPDTTLGDESSRLTPNVDIKGEIADLIEGGAIRDTNLFHSFLEFNVGDGQRVFFANPDNVINIFSRITGGNPSNIFGTLGVDGDANLFLINPNGIIFGENASLNVNGSFLATTAESIIFADGTKFSTIDTQTKPLLTVSIPIGLQLGETPGSIVNRSSTLAISPITGELEPSGLVIQPGRTLAFLGGELSLEQGIIATLGGQIELGSVAKNNTVGLTFTDFGFSLGYENVRDFQNINLSQGASVGTISISNEGGDINVSGRHISLSDGSRVSSFGLDEGIVGNIKIRASKLVEVIGVGVSNDQVIPSQLSTVVAQNATGEGRFLSIETEELIVKDGAQISTGTFGAGRAGNLTVNASDSVELIGTFPEGEFASGLLAPVAPSATGDGGTLTINTGRLSLKDGAQVTTSTFGAGNAGEIRVNASDSVELEGTAPNEITPSALLTQVEKISTATGNAGKITIETGQIIIKNGAQISSAARNIGKGGTININASDFIQLSGNSPKADLEEGSSGIFVSAEKPFIDEFISGETIFTTSDSGELNIKTRQLIVEDGARLSVDTFGTGIGGDLTLDVEQLIIRNGGQVGAGSRVEENPLNKERGKGGTLTVNATESVEVTGSGIIGNTLVNSTLFTQAQGTGNAGNLNINTPKLTVKDGGEITASTLDTGIAGNIILEVEDNILLSGNESGIFANTASNSEGQGGSISTKNQIPQTIIVRDGATIGVNSEGIGKGGNITLKAEELSLDNSSITAATRNSQGGNITLNIGNILRFVNDGEITATAGTAQAGGDGGNVTIHSDFILAFPTSNTHKITAQAFEGNGGEINIQTLGLFGTDFLDIDASSTGGGIDGTESIDILEIDPARSLTELPANVIDASQQITQGCTPKDREESGRFVATGRGGLPLSPNEPLRGKAVITNWVEEPTETTGKVNNQLAKTLVDEPRAEIVEAQGWIINDRGNLELVAEPPTNHAMPINIPCNSY